MDVVVSPVEPIMADFPLSDRHAGYSSRGSAAGTWSCLAIGLNSLSAFAVRRIGLEPACRQDPTVMNAVSGIIPERQTTSVDAVSEANQAATVIVQVAGLPFFQPRRFTGPSWSEPHNG
jgi:hypothetical protein